jgi:2-hydroxychromene-2-carboxylate isomerase
LSCKRKRGQDGTPKHQGLRDTKLTTAVLADAATTGKQTLIENTDQAFADGAFGLPWMVCTNANGKTEGFWGVDHIGQVAQFLGLDRTKGLGKSGWRAVL